MVFWVFTFLPILVIHMMYAQGTETCNKDLRRAFCDDLFVRMMQLKDKGNLNKEEPKRVVPAFGASVSRGKDLAPYEVVKFDSVWTNVGNGYNPTTGIFTAPTGGTYFFTGTGMTYHNRSLRLHLMRNSVKTVSLYPGTLGYNMGTLSMVLQLRKADRVYLQHFGVRENSLFSGEASSHFCMFSGYLISQ